MSLTKANLTNNIKKQYNYKLKSYAWVLNSLILMQILAILFSLGGISSSGGGGNGFSFNINYYSADMMIIFTMLWAFIIASQITSNKENEFMFVINQASHHFSDIAFMLTASVVGGITAILSGYLLKVVVSFYPKTILLTGSIPQLKYLLIGLLITIIYIFLFASLGYMTGTLIQFNKIFMFIIPVLFFGLLFIADKYGTGNFMFALFNFYAQETNVMIFALKAIVTSSVCFAGAFVISNRLEVRP